MIEEHVKTEEELLEEIEKLKEKLVNKKARWDIGTQAGVGLKTKNKEI